MQTKEPNSWKVRRPVLQRTLKQANPDLIGTQEGLYNQLREIAQDLPDYHWIGEGRRGGSHEFMAIFLKKSGLISLSTIIFGFLIHLIALLQSLGITAPPHGDLDPI